MHANCKPVLLVMLAAFCFCGPANAADAPNPSTVSADSTLDALVDTKMSEAGMVGLGAAILVERKVVWMKGYGFADKQRAAPFTPDTIMNIGSISKTFTGAAMMRAVEAGKLSLDVDINAYLPFKVTNPAYPDEPITLRQLATHTSSITDRSSVYSDAYHYGGDAPESLDRFLRDYFTTDGKDYSSANFLDVEPGTHREYSNIGAALVGRIVEIAVGERLNTYTRRAFFEPLGMSATGWFLSEIDRENHSTLYAAQDGLPSPIALYGLTTYPDGGVRTSVADLSKFFIALLDGGAYEGQRILGKQSVDEMTRFQYTQSNAPDNVNLKEKNSGLFWSTKFDVTRIGHSGSDPGLNTDMLASLSGDIAVIVFSNTSLCGQEAGAYGAIFERLWTHAEALRDASR